ncbi:hypothetical protein RAH32_03050 [Paracoccus sp. WLY502]|uniref:hypothetical protein n=1 Tax=Paracoccus yibinensis TaxID=3068891 RepID=UPI002796E0DE|nr:hypothetical protein [Paracoccus sp. WLY502]MDQ1899423.1 hypothetical protein [Paracoccus sp. WLY502]
MFVENLDIRAPWDSSMGKHRGRQRVLAAGYIEGQIAWGDAASEIASEQDATNGRISESIVALPACTPQAGSLGNGGICYENCLLIRPDTEQAKTATDYHLDLTGAPGLKEDSRESGVALIHCSIINLQSDDHYSGAYTPVKGTDFTFFRQKDIANNLIYTPNRADGTTSDGPFDLVPLWEMFDQGFTIEVARGVWPTGLPAAVPNGGTIFIPYGDLAQGLGGDAA